MFSFGDELKRERERRGVDLGEIARATHIARRFLEAIETGDVDTIPGHFYRRAYIRAYARYLGLDQDRIVGAFEFASSGPSPNRVHPIGETGGSRLAVAAAFKWLAWGLVGLGLTGAAAAVWHRAPQTVSPPTDVEVFRSPGSLETLVPPPPFVAEELEGEDPGPTMVQLTLRVNEPCWLEVSADGEQVAEGIMLRGFERVFRAAEVCFSLGNAGGVSYWIDDRPGRPLGQPGQVLKDICVSSSNISEFADQQQEGSSDR